MITSRNGKNKRGGRGFVKKSAKLSVLRTKGTVSSSSSTFSRMKKCRRWVCFEREWCCGLYAKSMADLLSRYSGVAFLVFLPSSLSSARK
eukprot:2046156-Pleurochrysis_carterae.AAC.1